MNDGVDVCPIKLQRSLLYQLLTDEIHTEELDELKDQEDSEDVYDVYQHKRRYTLETSEVKKKWKFTHKKPHIISEDLVEQTRKSFKNLSTVVQINSPQKFPDIINKKRIGILSSESTLLSVIKPVPYCAKRKRTKDNALNVSLQPQICANNLENDDLQFEQTGEGVRKRSYTLPHLTRSENFCFGPRSRVVLGSNCSNLVLKFVVERLKEISSFILENHDLFKISVPDLTKIIVRLLLLEISDKNLFFTVSQQHNCCNNDQGPANKITDNLPDASTMLSEPCSRILHSKSSPTNKQKLECMCESTSSATISQESNNGTIFENSTNLNSCSSMMLRSAQFKQSTKGLKKTCDADHKNSTSNSNFESADFQSYPKLSKQNGEHYKNSLRQFKPSKPIDSTDFAWPTLNFTKMVRQLVERYQGLGVTRSEHQQLKMAVLHMNGEFSTATQKKLQELVTSEFPKDPLRYSKLLLSLYSLCSIDVTMTTRFFCPCNLDVTTFVLQEIKG